MFKPLKHRHELGICEAFQAVCWFLNFAHVGSIVDVELVSSCSGDQEDGIFCSKFINY